MSEKDDEGFLSRWSRRKAAVRDGAAVPDPTVRESGTLGDASLSPPVDAAQTDQVPAAEKTEDEILAELGLPKPEDLQPGDGVAGFMKSSVPEFLRRRALRRLWTLNPALANLDRMIDYGEDYTDAALAVKTLQSTYEAGAGYKKLFAKLDEEEAARQEAAQQAAADEPDVAEESGAAEVADDESTEGETEVEAGRVHGMSDENASHTPQDGAAPLHDLDAASHVDESYCTAQKTVTTSLSTAPGAEAKAEPHASASSGFDTQNKPELTIQPASVGASRRRMRFKS